MVRCLAGGGARVCVPEKSIYSPTNSLSAVAEEQYNEIIQAQDAWHISDDGESDERYRDLRPTNSARRVKALFDQVSDRYRVVPRFHHRARFLIAIQVPILEQYHTRISSSLDAFEALSSTLMGAVPGALTGQAGHQFDKKRLIDGVEGLQRLLKAFVSARWITIAMQSWGEMLASTPYLKLKKGHSLFIPCSSISRCGMKLIRKRLYE
jgi:hypothetical protein